MHQEERNVNNYAQPSTPKPVTWSHAETLAALERFKRRYPDIYQRVRGKKAVAS